MNLFYVKVQFLRDIGVREDSVGSVLVRFPQLLTYSLYKKIRPVVCSVPFPLLFLFLWYLREGAGGRWVFLNSDLIKPKLIAKSPLFCFITGEIVGFFHKLSSKPKHKLLRVFV